MGAAWWFAVTMGNRLSGSKVSDVADSKGKSSKESGSGIDKLTEAQLDEFREAFNSFDKVRSISARPSSCNDSTRLRVPAK